MPDLMDRPIEANVYNNEMTINTELLAISEHFTQENLDVLA